MQTQFNSIFGIRTWSGATLGSEFSEPTAKSDLRLIDGGALWCHPARVGDPQDHEGKVDFPWNSSRLLEARGQEAPTGPPSPPQRPQWQCHVAGCIPECPGGAGWPPWRAPARTGAFLSTLNRLDSILARHQPQHIPTLHPPKKKNCPWRQCHVPGCTPGCPGGTGWPPRRESADAPPPVRRSKVDAKSTNQRSKVDAKSTNP